MMDLNPIGAPRRDWKKVLVGDGIVVVRHPDLALTLDLIGKVASRLEIVAG